MDKKDKIYVVLAVVLFVLLIAKSVYFDNYTPRNEDEKHFMEYVANQINEERGFLDKGNIITRKIVNINKEEDEGESIIEKYDENTNKLQEIRIRGQYKAKIRKYIFGFLPIGDYSILSRE